MLFSTNVASSMAKQLTDFCQLPSITSRVFLSSLSSRKSATCTSSKTFPGVVLLDVGWVGGRVGGCRGGGLGWEVRLARRSWSWEEGCRSLKLHSGATKTQLTVAVILFAQRIALGMPPHAATVTNRLADVLHPLIVQKQSGVTLVKLGGCEIEL